MTRPVVKEAYKLPLSPNYSINVLFPREQGETPMASIRQLGSDMRGVGEGDASRSYADRLSSDEGTSNRSK
ncbi:MAG: hypothetical protein WDM86_08815 [Rhizomicrobium sp.]